MTLNYTIYHERNINGDDVEFEINLTIDLTYIPACRGHRDRYGCPEEPDEPAGFEITSCSDADGLEYELTDKEYDDVMEKASELYRESCLRDRPDPDDV